MNLLKIHSLTRLQATLGHLILSFILFILIILFLMFVWFPGGFFWYEGGLQSMRIIAPVDLVLGPLLTFIIFKPKKKGLLIDVIFIFCVQIGALTWGLIQVHEVRPHYIVAYNDTFYPVNKESLIESEFNVHSLTGSETPAPLISPWQKSRYVYLYSPDHDTKIRREIAESLPFSDSFPWGEYHDYRPIPENFNPPTKFKAAFAEGEVQFNLEKGKIISMTPNTEISFWDLLTAH